MLGGVGKKFGLRVGCHCRLEEEEKKLGFLVGFDFLLEVKENRFQ